MIRSDVRRIPRVGIRCENQLAVAGRIVDQASFLFNGCQGSRTTESTDEEAE